MPGKTSANESKKVADRHKPRRMVSIDPDQRDRLAELARERDRSVTWMVRFVIAQYLNGPTQQ